MATSAVSPCLGRPVASLPPPVIPSPAPIMEQLLRSLALGGAGQRAADNPQHPDSSETVNISALALLKMMRHSRAGVPLEVMGLMLGNFVDDYTINVVDVFAMPQSGTSVTVESVDPVYQTKHMDLLKMAGRTEMVVGWYHSHPGFGCWLSGVDCQTQQSFEALHPRAVAVVVDPIQSVKGKVVIDAFRSINPLSLGSRGLAPTSESRQVTSNLGHLERPSIVSTLHGLGTRYYSLNIGYKMGAKDQKMLMALNKKSWLDGLALQKYDKRAQENDERMAEMIKLTNLFTKDTLASKPATKKDAKKQQIEKYGKLNSRQRLEQSASSMMCENIVQQLGAMVNSKACQ